MSHLKRLIHEIHRRSLWQVLSVYLISAWIALQVADTVTSALGLPDWVPQFALVLLIVLLPVVLATALVQEGVPVRAAVAAEAESEEGEPRSEVPESEEPPAHHNLLTWRNAGVAAVAMLALLTVSAGGYMGLRASGVGPFATLVSKGVLEERDRIVLAEFENHTSDGTLSLVVTEALRIDLGQSPLIRIADHRYVAGVLERMDLPEDEALDAERAREVAVREGLKAIIAGEIGRAGSSYVLSAEIVSAATGEPLVGLRETAETPESIVVAIDRLSKRLRERVGESLKTIRANPPLAQVTTASLDALRKYSLARRSYYVEGDQARALSLLEEAVGLDSSFASAWAFTGVIIANWPGQRARAVEAFTRAYELGDRLTDVERYQNAGLYWDYVMGEPDKAITAYRSLLDIYPDDGVALNNLANMYFAMREWAQAEEMYRQVLVLDDSVNVIPFANIIQVQFFQGKYDEARASHAAMAQKLPGHPWVGMYAWALASATGDYADAEAHSLALREAQKASPQWRSATSWQMSNQAYVQGKLAEGARHRRDAMKANEERGFGQAYIVTAVQIATMAVALRGDVEAAIRTADSALARYPLDSLEPLDRPYLILANLYSLAKLPDRARVMLQEYEAIDADLRRGNQARHHMSRGVLAMAEARIDDAIDEFRRWDAETDCPVCALAELGRAYEEAGQPDSSVAMYTRYIETPDLWRCVWDAVYLASTYERLGSLYEDRGEADKAVYYYGKLVDLWENADPELQPRVEAARRAIQALSSDT